MDTMRLSAKTLVVALGAFLWGSVGKPYVGAISGGGGYGVAACENTEMEHVS